MRLEYSLNNNNQYIYITKYKCDNNLKTCVQIDIEEQCEIKMKKKKKKKMRIGYKCFNNHNIKCHKVSL